MMISIVQILYLLSFIILGLVGLMTFAMFHLALDTVRDTVRNPITLFKSIYL